MRISQSDIEPGAAYRAAALCGLALLALCAPPLAADTASEAAAGISEEPDDGAVLAGEPVDDGTAAGEPDAPPAGAGDLPAADAAAATPPGEPAGPAVPLAEAVEQAAAAGEAETLKILDAEVPPGSYRRLSWSATELFEGIPVATPVLVVNGSEPGPTLCLTAAVHGDELNGIEMVRRVLHDLDPDDLAGTVIGVPIVNLQGFRRGSRYLPDRRDLNRVFPGRAQGSAAARIAHSFFTELVVHCDALIDLHTGSFERSNLPQLRADLRNPDVVTLTQGFGATVILNSQPRPGTLRYAATRAGIPTVTLEAGGPSRLEPTEVKHGVKGIETLLNTLGMVRKISLWGEPEPVYYRSKWVRASRGGILLADVHLGGRVREGDLLGTITDPITNARTNVYAPFDGRVIGMARNQVVMPGFAAFHLGIQRPEPEALAEDTIDDDRDSGDENPGGLSESELDDEIDIDDYSE